MSTQKVICVHLLNDFSGSPLVFSQAIDSLESAEITLYTNHEEGFLSEVDIEQKHVIPYAWSPHSFITLMRFLYAQLWLFITFLRNYREENVIIYINTVLPFGAALAGKLLGKRVIYHMHETSIRPKLLKYFLFTVANFTASDAIYVSDFLRKKEPLSRVKSHKVHNALSPKFTQYATRKRKISQEEEEESFHVLMLCSLKTYKGVYDFVKLASMMPNYQFSLVLNSTASSIAGSFEHPLPQNLTIYPCQRNVHPFYQKADLVINLSNPAQWVETFGMTILEGMVYGLPAIVPPAGGVTELIEDGINGYQIHPKNHQAIQHAIESLANQKGLYDIFSQNALRKTQQFSQAAFGEQINQIIGKSLNLRKSSSNERFKQASLISNN